MLKQEYTSESDIPKNLKGAYVANGGVWVLDDLSDSHPLIAKNKELISKNTTYKNLNAELETEKARLESKTIPKGFVAVKKDIAEVAEQIQSLKIPIEELPTLKQENDDFKAQQAKVEAKSLRLAAADSLGYKNKDAFAQLAVNLSIEKDGDKFVVVDGEDRKPLTKELVESNEAFKPFISSLNYETPTGHTNDPPPSGDKKSIFDAIRQKVKDKADSKPVVDIDARFGRAAKA